MQPISNDTPLLPLFLNILQVFQLVKPEEHFIEAAGAKELAESSKGSAHSASSAPGAGSGGARSATCASQDAQSGE